MSKLLVLFALSIGICIAAPQAFDAATVKPANPGEPNPGDIPRNMDASPGRFLMRNVPLRYCIQWAYDLKDYQVTGPDWAMDTSRFDIQAVAPGASQDDMRVMLQNLILERFEMKAHRESRILDVYALMPGKGPSKLKPASDDEQTALAAGPTPGSTKFVKQPVSRFTFLLTRRLARPTIDMTGLDGLYDFTIDLSGLGFNGGPPNDPSAPSVFTTVQADLGLRLEAMKAPIDVLVIDRADKTPMPN